MDNETRDAIKVVVADLLAGGLLRIDTALLAILACMGVTFHYPCRYRNDALIGMIDALIGYHIADYTDRDQLVFTDEFMAEFGAGGEND